MIEKIESLLDLYRKLYKICETEEEPDVGSKTVSQPLEEMYNSALKEFDFSGYDEFLPKYLYDFCQYNDFYCVVDLGINGTFEVMADRNTYADCSLSRRYDELSNIVYSLKHGGADTIKEALFLSYIKDMNKKLLEDMNDSLSEIKNTIDNTSKKLEEIKNLVNNIDHNLYVADIYKKPKL